MLVLSRQKDETIIVGDDIEITVVDVRGDKIRLGVSAPKSISVHRKAVYDAIRRENREAAQVKPEDLLGFGKVRPDFSARLPEPVRPAGSSSNRTYSLPSTPSSRFKYQSCFLSCSSKDDAFCRKLHWRLRDAGVDVWYAPVDMVAGQMVQDQVRAAIGQKDRVLFILSEHSMASNWVESELRWALEHEGKVGKKLFPIRIVSMENVLAWKCFDATAGHDIAQKVREYFIPDFSNWEQEPEFYSAITKLLSALQR
jgi:carbon storage regulator